MNLLCRGWPGLHPSLSGLSAGAKGVCGRPGPPPHLWRLNSLHPATARTAAPLFLSKMHNYIFWQNTAFNESHTLVTQPGHRSLEAFHVLCDGGWCSLLRRPFLLSGWCSLLSRPFLLKGIEYLTFSNFLQFSELDFLVRACQW